MWLLDQVILLLVCCLGHFSTVTMEIVEQDDRTKLRLIQAEVPEEQLDQTEQGWKRHYFECMKKTFGYGSWLL